MKIPHNLMAETAVLGNLVICGERFPEVISPDIGLDVDDFYLPAHRAIFSAMKCLYESGSPVDVIMILDKDPGIDASVLSKLSDGAVRKENLAWYAGILKASSVLRKQFLAAHEVVDYFERGGDEPSFAQTKWGLGDYYVPRGWKGGSSVSMASSVEGLLDRVASKQSGDTSGGLLSTGKRNLDEYFQYEAGKLYVIAGRPGMGKTAFVLDQASSLAQKVPVLFFEQEMPAEEIAMRLAGNLSRVPFGSIRDASPESPLDSEQWARLSAAYSTVRDGMDIDICDTPNRSIDDVRAELRRNNQARAAGGRPPIGCIIFDYIQIANLGENRVQSIGDFTSTLKNIAREFNLIAIALSQLSRPPKQSYDKDGIPHIPRLDDLRDSGSIEQDADMVAFIHRPEYYLKTTGRPVGTWASVVQVPISKNRGGKIGMATLGWVGEIMAFSDPWWSSEETNDSGTRVGSTGSKQGPQQASWS